MKKFGLFIIVLLVIALIGVAVYFALPKDNDNKNTSGDKTIVNVNSKDKSGDTKKAKIENPNTKERYNAFYEVVKNYNDNSVWPNGEVVYRLGTSYEEDQDAFAIFDVDGDKQDELIIRHSDATMAEMVLMIYDYDNEKDEIVEEYLGSPFSTFYKSGFIRRDASHNQGKAFEFMWPHSLEKYDEANDTYYEFAYIDGWDKEFDTIFPSYLREGEHFPTDIDKDGNGGVYSIFEAGSGENKYVDDAEYEAWMNKKVGKLEELVIPYELFTNENIDSIKK